MAHAARARGLEYMVLTDHSPSLGVTRGLSPERIAEQKVELDRLNGELAPFRILHGTELEIRSDGSLDYPDELLATFDVVVASIHTGRSQPTEQLTRRALSAIENPHVDIIAHPTGRIVNRRDPVSYDWPQVFEAAARTGTRLEINGSPRLDLDERLARDAARAGVQLSLASDAHRTEELVYLDYAVGVARRAWLGPEQVANVMSAEEWTPMSVVADGRRLLRTWRVVGARGIKRAGPVLLPLFMAALVAVGWVVDVVALAGVLALELALAGLGRAALLGAARPSSGYARYAILAVSAVSITLVGRLLPPGIGPLAAPLAWVFLIWVLYIERHGPDMAGYRLSLDLTLVLTVFSATAGMSGVMPSELWLLGLILLGALVFVACLRAAEARGALGVTAVGHALLHLLVVLQVATAMLLLELPQPVGAALVALTFHSWSGAADALESGVSDARRRAGVRLVGRDRRHRGAVPLWVVTSGPEFVDTPGRAVIQTVALRRFRVPNAAPFAH